MRNGRPGSWLKNRDSLLWIGFARGAALACQGKEAPALQPPAAPPPPPPPAPVVRDAAAEVGDAATDAPDARVPAKKWMGGPAGPAAGGGGALKVEGSLSRADGDKVVRAAQPKLRGCFEEANPNGAGRKGR